MKGFTKLDEGMRESGIDTAEAELELETQKNAISTAKSKLKTPNVKGVGEVWLTLEKHIPFL